VTFDLQIGSRVTPVMSFHPDNFRLPRPFCSQVRSKQAIDRRTDRDQPYFLQYPFPTEVGNNNNNICISIPPWVIASEAVKTFLCCIKEFEFKIKLF